MLTSWTDVSHDEPKLAESVHATFVTAKQATIATLRRDGSPRIGGTEVSFADDGYLYLAMMPRTRRAEDLRRDPRMALHSPTMEADDTDSWSEAKLDARAVEVEDNRFRLDICRISLLRIIAGTLEVTSWTPESGLQHNRRC
jgi:Pyridoxamine 5'-phosphate oxidase